MLHTSRDWGENWAHFDAERSEERYVNIGTAAKNSGVPPKTIRYYENIGLIRLAERGPNGYRIYDETDVQTLRFIRHARNLGFTVKDVADLLALRSDDIGTNVEVETFALRGVARIERKLRKLTTLKRSLLDLAERGHGDGWPGCPVIDESPEAVSDGDYR